MRKIILKRAVTATGGRQGHLLSEDGNIDLKLDLPTELGGHPAPHTTNPEQLFAAGYASCFASSLEYILTTEQVKYEQVVITSNALLLKDDAGGFKFGIDLVAQIKGLDKKIAKQYVDLAYAFCPYSKAIRGNVEVKIEVK
ncbi:MAG TPA: Ohr family peroxiredoxin [Bacilli bacterium]|jgi:Ohr subfamily peroxiredoxin|nr:Ohr family peroxiredoxin [Bacilli bacterium]